jgi:hypothetical protein
MAKSKAQIQAIVKNLLDEERKSSTIKDISNAFIRHFGGNKGVDGVMAELKLQFDGPGSAADKSRILLAGLALMQTAAEKGGGKDMFAGLDDEDMQAAVLEASKTVVYE